MRKQLKNDEDMKKSSPKKIKEASPKKPNKGHMVKIQQLKEAG